MGNWKRAAALLLLVCLLTGCAGKEPVAEEGYTPTGQNNSGVDKNKYDDASFVQVGGFTVYEGDASSYVGVDVSSYQKEINWTQVAEAGVSFAMLRVGYRGYTLGGLNPDSMFEANLTGAQEAGLDVGIYFFSQAITPSEAEEEAWQVVEWIKGLDITYPVVFDWEPIDGDEARTDGVTPETVTECAKAFCAVIESAGYTPMIYFNRSQGYDVMDLEQLQQYDFWLASYSELPNFNYHFEMWQYSCTGSVPGIEGNVDLNLCLTEYPKQTEE